MSLIETDPQERQAEIDRLIFDATVRGVVPLPTLTDDQLCVLSEGRWPLTDVPVWTDWAALDPGVRFARGERALRELAAAGHVLGWQHDAHGWTVSAAPALALLTAARARPSYAAFGAGLGAGHEVRAPRWFGIGASDGADHLVVVELLVAGARQHRLMSPTRLSRSVAEWAAACLTSAAMGQQVPAVAVLLVRPGPDASVPGADRVADSGAEPGAYAVRVASQPGHPGFDVDARTALGERIARQGCSVDEVDEVVARVLQSAAPERDGS